MGIFILIMCFIVLIICLFCGDRELSEKIKKQSYQAYQFDILLEENFNKKIAFKLNTLIEDVYFYDEIDCVKSNIINHINKRKIYFKKALEYFDIKVLRGKIYFEFEEVKFKNKEINL